MSEARKRELGDDDDLGLFRGVGGGAENADVEMPEAPGAQPDPSADLNAEDVARLKAAKRQRQRKRAAADGEADADDADAPRKGGKGQGNKKKGSALPALRPDLKPDTPALRAERVEAIRRDLVRRRRRKGGNMLLKVWFFVLMPTLFVGWYLYSQATDHFRSDANFMIETAMPAGAPQGGGLGGLLGGGLSGMRESSAVQNFILSRDVLRRLDADHGIIAHFRDSGIDWYHRDRGSTFEAAYQHYLERVTVSFDPTEGQLDMSVVAASPEAAERFSRAIIGYAEDMVNSLQDPIRAAALNDAEANLADAEAKLEAAQFEVARLRKTLETFSVESEVSAEMSIIAALESEREMLISRLAALRRALRADDARVTRAADQIATLDTQIRARRQNLAGSGQPDTRSLADVSAALERANFRVQSAMALFAAAIESREGARLEVSRQGRYLSIIEQPSIPDRANFPRKWEMTALAFLCFLGVYIIGSLTVSLIREQASI